MKDLQVVGAAIFQGKKILAARRSPTMKAPMKWEFAGGKLEENESHHQALIREVYEELGVKIEVKEFIAAGHSVLEDRKITLYVYCAGIIEGVPLASEHSEIRWIDINEIEELDWAEADIPACKKLQAMKL